MTITRITGYTQKGVPPTADRALYAALAGPDSYVLPYGAKIAASLKDAQHLTVQDGAILHNGTLSTFDGSTEFVIPPGVQGSKRSNIAVARHLNDGTIESTIPLVLSGEPTSDGEPADPTLETGNLLDGATVSDMPLYRVVTDGISAGEPEPLFDTLASISEVRDSLSQRSLWSSEGGFSSGSMEVPGISSYSCLLIRAGNIWALASVTMDKTKVMGGSAFLYNSSSYRTLVMDFALSGDTLTYGRALEQGASAIIQDRIAVNEIVGLF